MDGTIYAVEDSSSSINSSSSSSRISISSRSSSGSSSNSSGSSGSSSCSSSRVFTRELEVEFVSVHPPIIIRFYCLLPDGLCYFIPCK